MFVTDICTRDVIHIRPEATVRQAAQLMRRAHVGALVVVEQPNGKCFPVGMLTDRDIAVAVVAPGVDADVITVGDVMTPEVIGCAARDDVFDALQQMRSRGVRRLPVLDEVGALCGLLSADDVIGAIATHLFDLSAALRREQVNEMRARV
jgi:CBS domain-containing protein